jgi:hypothetical protein
LLNYVLSERKWKWHWWGCGNRDLSTLIAKLNDRHVR